jgi:DNA-binding transcriptional LysR family regulator
VAENIKARSSIELRQIRYFVTLAQELNFRKAAERLFITQPALSHQIATLEAILGVRLFQRDRRQVVLTQAGHLLLDDARHLLTEGDAILTKARRMGSARSATLRIGFPEYANRTLIPDIISAFRSRHPEARVTLTEAYGRQLLHELREGRLDVAFILIPSVAVPPDLELEPVMEEKAGLLLAATHRLARFREIPVAALANEQLYVGDPSVPVFNVIAGWLQQAGVRPRFYNAAGSEVYSYETAMRLIESGDALGIAGPSITPHLPPGVVFRPVSGPAPHFRGVAAWFPTKASPLLEDFLRLIRASRAPGNGRLT